MHVLLLILAVGLALWLNKDAEIWTLKRFGRDIALSWVIIEISWFAGTMLV